MELANYYSRIRPILRSKGNSIASTVAYITRGKLAEIGTCTTHDYRHKSGDLFAVIVTCWSKCDLSIQEIVDIFERSEKHPKANLGRDLLITIPRELATDPQLMTELVRLISQTLSTTLKTFTISAIHLGANSNPHAHIFIPNREFDPGLDPASNKQQGAGKKSEQFRCLTNPRKSGTMVREIREIWAHLQNKCFKNLGIRKRVYSGSYKSIGYPYLPTYHVGNQGGEIAETAKTDNNLITKRNQILRDSTIFADIRILKRYKRSLVRRLKQLELEKQANKSSGPARDTSNPKVQDEARPMPPSPRQTDRNHTNEDSESKEPTSRTLIYRPDFPPLFPINHPPKKRRRKQKDKKHLLEQKSDLEALDSKENTSDVISNYFSIPTIDGKADPNFDFDKAFNKLLRNVPPGGYMPVKRMDPKRIQRIREKLQHSIGTKKKRGIDRC
ncbi:MobA/MobL family protein [Pelagicoccus mobilis]|uniref:MobA/MobL family protein n=1 Tax=Pelagicoccus mobilis TaxID=415221 RepID=A0A934VSM9_9BACT|nr:MobA/MobL family protein [Pelagicoccus mobilis]MBK1880597.1 MobA/MobL family protein [Pelagicoccus mobilis]